MITLRQTSLNEYEKCPYLFKYDWGDIGEPERYADNNSPQNKYSSLGIALHKTMEVYGKEKIKGHTLTPLELHDVLDGFYNDIEPSLFDDKDDAHLNYNSLHYQLDWLYPHRADIIPLAVEMPFGAFKIIDGLPEFIGTIDVLEGSMTEKSVDIIDYKTGKTYTKAELQDNIQATVYSLAFRHMFGFYPEKFVFYFSRFGKTKTIWINSSFISQGVLRIKNIYTHILNKDFEPMNRQTFFCKHFCHAEDCIHYPNKSDTWNNVGFDVFNYKKNVV